MLCVRHGRNAQSSKLFMESNRIHDQGVWFKVLTPVRCFYGAVKSAAPKLFRLSIDFQDRNKCWKTGLSDASQVLISDLVSKTEKYFLFVFVVFELSTCQLGLSHRKKDIHPVLLYSHRQRFVLHFWKWRVLTLHIPYYHWMFWVTCRAGFLLIHCTVKWSTSCRSRCWECISMSCWWLWWVCDQVLDLSKLNGNVKTSSTCSTNSMPTPLLSLHLFLRTLGLHHRFLSVAFGSLYNKQYCRSNRYC